MLWAEAPSGAFEGAQISRDEAKMQIDHEMVNLAPGKAVCCAVTD
jgi:hypothetical protein